MVCWSPEYWFGWHNIIAEYDSGNYLALAPDYHLELFGKGIIGENEKKRIGRYDI